MALDGAAVRLRFTSTIRHEGERLHTSRRRAVVDRTYDLVQPASQPSVLPSGRSQTREGKLATVSDGASEHKPHTPAEQENSELKNLPSVFALLTMGTTVAFIIGVFVVLGIWADRAWGTAPWGLLIGIALGTVAAVVSVVKQVRRFL